MLVFNARVQMTPENLEEIVRKILASGDLTIEIETLRCLMPGRPNPTHRFDAVVEAAETQA